MSVWEMTVGLETHVELKTRAKAFCSCENRYGAEPNTLTCPVCLGLPGTLPVLNREAIRLAALAGLALHCQVHTLSAFDRKNFFYPDLPKAYQITQFFHPLCTGGYVDLSGPAGEKRIGIARIHVEEDAGKLLHGLSEGVTGVDFNRSGVPLIEIVTEPEFHAPEEASAYLRKLRAILICAGVSDCRMNEGSLRCDVNLSVRRPGEPLGVRTEMKNLNSFQSVEKAIRAEYARQVALLEAGEAVVQETRRFDQRSGQTFPMRGKEDSADYRYFPEPDIPPVRLSPGELEELRASLPVLPDRRRALLEERYGLERSAAELLAGERWLADYFEAAAALAQEPKALARLLLGETFALLTQRGQNAGEREADCLPVAPAHMAALSDLISSGQVNSSTGKKILAVLMERDQDPVAYARERRLFLVTDEETLRAAALRAVQQNPGVAESYRRGKETALQALMGKAMAETRGRAAPQRLEALLRQVLREEET